MLTRVVRPSYPERLEVELLFYPSKLTDDERQEFERLRKIVGVMDREAGGDEFGQELLLMGWPKGKMRSGYDIDEASGCWLWHPAPARGYGRVGSSSIPAHRFMYEQLVGPIPEGFDVGPHLRSQTLRQSRPPRAASSA